jgi:hypothetical protein
VKMISHILNDGLTRLDSGLMSTRMHLFAAATKTISGSPRYHLLSLIASMLMEIVRVGCATLQTCVCEMSHQEACSHQQLGDRVL